jgi:hypothetical protein
MKTLLNIFLIINILTNTKVFSQEKNWYSDDLYYNPLEKKINYIRITQNNYDVTEDIDSTNYNSSYTDRINRFERDNPLYYHDENNSSNFYDPYYTNWGWNNWGWTNWGWNNWGWNNWGWNNWGWNMGLGWNNWGWNMGLGWNNWGWNMGLGWNFGLYDIWNMNNYGLTSNYNYGPRRSFSNNIPNFSSYSRKDFTNNGQVQRNLPKNNNSSKIYNKPNSKYLRSNTDNINKKNILKSKKNQSKYNSFRHSNKKNYTNRTNFKSNKSNNFNSGRSGNFNSRPSRSFRPR